MSNILAIAQKELKGYFASPIAYVVIGFFALMFGCFFYTLLDSSIEQSTRMMGMQGGPTQNVNEQMISAAVPERERASCCSCCR